MHAGLKTISLKVKALVEREGGAKNGGTKMKVFLKMLMKTKGQKKAFRDFCRC